jgi:hypothetical protein
MGYGPAGSAPMTTGWSCSGRFPASVMEPGTRSGERREAGSTVRARGRVTRSFCGAHLTQPEKVRRKGDAGDNDPG